MPWLSSLLGFAQGGLSRIPNHTRSRKRTPPKLHGAVKAQRSHPVPRRRCPLCLRGQGSSARTDRGGAERRPERRARGCVCRRRELRRAEGARARERERQRAPLRREEAERGAASVRAHGACRAPPRLPARAFAGGGVGVGAAPTRHCSVAAAGGSRAEAGVAADLVLRTLRRVRWRCGGVRLAGGRRRGGAARRGGLTARVARRGRASCATAARSARGGECAAVALLHNWQHTGSCRGCKSALPDIDIPRFIQSACRAWLEQMPGWSAAWRCRAQRVCRPQKSLEHSS